MQIIQIKANANGAYPPIQNWPHLTAPLGFAVWPGKLSTDEFYAHNGFVRLTVKNGTVQSYVPNLDAWKAWKASLPPDEPAPPEAQSDMDKLASAYREGVESA